ncbi:hypothetical protein EDD21DRAFT_434181, partial [Dissophora ornata]
HISILLWISLSKIVYAQSFQPYVTWGSSSAFEEGRAMYVLGGNPEISRMDAGPQAFVVDLSVSWDASSPVFKSLPNGPNASMTTGALSFDGQGWFSLVNGTGYLYNITSGAWGTLPTSTNLSSGSGLSASTDPDTGIIYIPNGYVGTNKMSRMLMVNVVTKTIDSTAMHPSLNTSQFYSASWSASRGSLLFYEGPANGLYAYNPTEGWNDLSQSVKGDTPAPRTGACFEPAYGGSKMILFGGTNSTGNNTLDVIYILDVATLTWTRGPDAGVANGRVGAACAISNDQFIAWGGITSGQANSTFPSNAMLVFDLKATAWTTKYHVGYSLAMIIGSIAGVIVILLIIGGAILYRTRTKRGAIANDIPKTGPYQHPSESTHSLTHTPTYVSKERRNNVETSSTHDSIASTSTRACSNISTSSSASTKINISTQINPSTKTNTSTNNNIRTNASISSNTSTDTSIDKRTVNEKHNSRLSGLSTTMQFRPVMESIMIQIMVDHTPPTEQQYDLPEIHIDDRTLRFPSVPIDITSVVAPEPSAYPAYHTPYAYF